MAGMKTRGQKEKLAEQGLPNTPPQALETTTRPRRSTRQTSQPPKSRSASVESTQSDVIYIPKTKALSKPKGRDGVTKKSKDTRAKAPSGRRKGRSRQTTPASDAEDEASVSARHASPVLAPVVEENEREREQELARSVSPSRDEVAHHGPPIGNEAISISSASPFSSLPSTPEIPAPSPRRLSETVNIFREILGDARPVAASMPAETLVDNQDMAVADEAAPVSARASPAQYNRDAIPAATQTSPSPVRPSPRAPMTSAGVQTNFSGAMNAEFILREAGRGPARDGTIVPYSTVSVAVPTEMVPALGEWIANHRLLRGTDLPLLIDQELKIQLIGHETYSELPDENGNVNVNGEMKLPIYNQELDTDSEHEDAEPTEPQTSVQVPEEALPSAQAAVEVPQQPAPASATPAQQVETPELRTGFFSALSRTVSRFVPTFGRTAAAAHEPSSDDLPEPDILPQPRTVAQIPRSSIRHPPRRPRVQPSRPINRRSPEVERFYRTIPQDFSPLPPGEPHYRTARQNQFMDSKLLYGPDEQIGYSTKHIPSNPTDRIRREKWSPVLTKIGEPNGDRVSKARLTAYTDKLKEQRRQAKKSKRLEDLEKIEDANSKVQAAEEKAQGWEDKWNESQVELFNRKEEQREQWAEQRRLRTEEIMKQTGGTHDNPFNARRGLEKLWRKETLEEFNQLMEVEMQRIESWERYCRLAGLRNADGSYPPRENTANAVATDPRLIKLATGLDKDLDAETAKLTAEKEAEAQAKAGQQAPDPAANNHLWFTPDPPPVTDPSSSAGPSQTEEQVQATQAAQQPQASIESAQQSPAQPESSQPRKRGTKGKKRKRSPSPIRSGRLPDGSFGLEVETISYSSPESSGSDDESDESLSPPPPKRRETKYPKPVLRPQPQVTGPDKFAPPPPPFGLRITWAQAQRADKIWRDRVRERDIGMRDRRMEGYWQREADRNRAAERAIYQAYFEETEEDKQQKAEAKREQVKAKRAKHHAYVADETEEGDLSTEIEATPVAAPVTTPLAAPVERSPQPDSGALVFKVPSPTTSDDDSEYDRTPSKGKSPATPSTPAPAKAWGDETPPPMPTPPSPLPWNPAQEFAPAELSAMRQREAVDKYKPRDPSHLRFSSRISNSTIVTDDDVESQPSPAATPATTFSSAPVAGSQSTIGSGPFNAYDEFVADQPMVGFLVDAFVGKDPGSFAAAAAMPFAAAFASLEEEVASSRPAAALDVQKWVEENFTAEKRAEALRSLAPIWEQATQEAST